MLLILWMMRTKHAAMTRGQEALMIAMQKYQMTKTLVLEH